MSIEDDFDPDGAEALPSNRFFDDGPEIRGARRVEPAPAQRLNGSGENETVFVTGSGTSPGPSGGRGVPDDDWLRLPGESRPAGSPGPGIPPAPAGMGGEGLRWSRTGPGHESARPAAAPIFVEVEPHVDYRPSSGSFGPGGGLASWWADAADRRAYWSVAGVAVLAAVVLLAFVTFSLRGGGSNGIVLNPVPPDDAADASTPDTEPAGPGLSENGVASSGSFQVGSTTAVGPTTLVTRTASTAGPASSTSPATSVSTSTVASTAPTTSSTRTTSTTVATTASTTPSTSTTVGQSTTTTEDPSTSTTDDPSSTTDPSTTSSTSPTSTTSSTSSASSTSTTRSDDQDDGGGGAGF